MAESSRSASPLAPVLFLSGAFVIATLASLLRLTLTIFADSHDIWWPVVAAIAVALIAAGVLASVRQKNFARVLAYASLAQIGYMLLALVSGDETALTALAYYLFTYLFIVTGAFAILLAIRHKSAADGHRSSLNGLGRPQPGRRCSVGNFCDRSSRLSTHRWIFRAATPSSSRCCRATTVTSPGSPHFQLFRWLGPICASPSRPGAATRIQMLKSRSSLSAHRKPSSSASAHLFLSPRACILSPSCAWPAMPLDNKPVNEESNSPAPAKANNFSSSIRHGHGAPLRPRGCCSAGGVLGFFLDRWFHTKPYLMLVFGALGFFGGVRDIIRRTSGSAR